MSVDIDEGKYFLIKYLMFFFNFAFWLCGLLLTIVIMIIYIRYGNLFSYADNKFAIMSCALAILGFGTFIMGIVGCCGTGKEHYCMVTAFAIFLLITLILAVIASSIGFSYKDKVHQVVDNSLTRAINNYNYTEDARKLLDWTQKNLKCCGNKGPRDFYARACNNTRGILSCYENETCTGKFYTTGCNEGLTRFLNNYLFVIGAISIGIAFVQLMGIVLACALMKTFTERQLYVVHSVHYITEPLLE